MFHAQNGWFFSRNPDGSVVIEHRAYGAEKNELGELMYTIDAKENLPAGIWASVMASVSARGETRDTWIEAGQFHNNPPALPDE